MATFLDLARARKGHFQMESGLHCSIWYDLETAFVDQAALDPFVTQLAQSLRRYDIEAVCGPTIGGAFLAQLLARLLGAEFYFTLGPKYLLPPGTSHRLLGKRVAIVDDVMSAGSSLRATLREVESHGGIPIVVGALYVLGSAGANFFTERGLRIESTGRSAFDSWRPSECPLCAADAPLEDLAGPRA